MGECCARRLLVEHGACVHLVGHEIDERFRRDPRVVCHDVPRPRSAAPLAESLLSRRGLSVAAQGPPARRTRVSWSTVETVLAGRQWVHAVHAVWQVQDEGAPAWVKVKHRAVKAIARRQERAALRAARTVIANSQVTRRAIVEARPQSVTNPRNLSGVGPLVGAGSGGRAVPARDAFRIPADDPVMAYVGTMGFNLNKGFDVLWRAWERLVAAGRWNGTLIVAGGGGRLPFWRRRAHGPA